MGTTYVDTHDWAKYFNDQHAVTVPHITQYHHFCTTDPATMAYLEWSMSKEQSTRIFPIGCINRRGYYSIAEHPQKSLHNDKIIYYKKEDH